MILSASRRTDIPNYYSEWFLNRIKEGYLYVRNPMNHHQVSRILLTPEVVDCIVFWTKNPEPMLSRLEELSAYQYYFQFTLTGFGRDIEPNVPHKKKCVIPIFQKLSCAIGRERVIWRYDPIIFTQRYTPEYHLKAFAQIAGALKGFTSKCVVSFVDLYAKNQKNMQSLDPFFLPEQALLEFGAEIASIAGKNGMKIAACAENMDLSACGIGRNCCIDRELVEQLTGCKIHGRKDRNQRPECGCMESVEVGTYNTCQNGCLYCYANYSPKSVSGNCRLYDVNSPILCGKITENDKITDRKMNTCREEQLSIIWE